MWFTTSRALLRYLIIGLACLLPGAQLSADQSRPFINGQLQFEASLQGLDHIDQHLVLVLELKPSESQPQNPRYGRIRAWYDPYLQVFRRARFWDNAGQPAVTVEFLDIRPNASRHLAHCLRITEHQRDDVISKIELESGAVLLPRFKPSPHHLNIYL